jgi:poly(hydroxyalkanoate) granule-associated protein
MTTEKEPEQVTERERYPLLESVRKVLLASVGAVAIAQDEIEELVDRLIERGEIAEKEGRTLVQDMMERRRSQAKHTEQEMDQRLEEMLHRINVPTKSDIDALSAKIAALTEKVEQLSQSQHE